jgi:hypothetical protein
MAQYTPSVSGAFNPIGNTVTFLANTLAPAAVQCLTSSANNISYCQYRIFNSGSSLVFMGVGANTLIANNNATVVTTTGNAIPVLPGSLEIISYPINSYFTAITSTGTSQVYVTPGLGL